MAQSMEAEGNVDSLVSQNDLIAESNDLKQHITAFLESNLNKLNGHLKTLNESLKEVADTADRAYEMVGTHEKTVKDLETSEKALKDRLTF